MLSFKQYVNTPVQDSDMKSIEVYANNLLKANGFYLRFSSHFKERVNDERNGAQITKQEITTLLNKAVKKYPKLFLNVPKTGEKEIVFTDRETSLNIPAIIRWSPRRNQNELFFKTIMRKKNFQSSNNGTPQFVTEENAILINI